MPWIKPVRSKIAEQHPVRLSRHGQAYSGHWSLEDGRLAVASAYGSKTALLGRKAPETLAETLFAEILDEQAP